MAGRKSVSKARGKQIMRALRGEDISTAGSSEKRTKREVPREPSSEVDPSSKVVLPEKAKASSVLPGAMDATPAIVAEPVPRMPTPSSADRGEGSSAGVTTVNFTLPSDFMAGHVLDGTMLFPHLDKYSLPSFRERFQGVPAGEIGSRVASLAFTTFQSSLALYAEVSKAEELAASALEREKAALEREKLALARADELAVQLFDAQYELQALSRTREMSDEEL